jgi:hypothetical protein
VHSLALIPPPILLGVFIAVGAALALSFRRPSTASLLLTAIILIPWASVISPGLLLWQNPLALIIWLAVAIDVGPGARIGRHVAWTRAATAFIVAVATFATVAFVVDSRRVTGDEPHYLIVASSILRDGDFDLTNDYNERRHVDFYPGSLEPRHVIDTASGQQYSFHGMGTSLLILPAFAAGGVYATRLFLLIVCAFGVVALWNAARLLTDSTSAAWAALAALICQIPFAAQASGIYPDAPAAAITSLALWTLIAIERAAGASPNQIVWTSAALALLPWLHIRLSSIALVFGVCFWIALWRRNRQWSSIVLFSAIPIVSAVVWWMTTYVMFDAIDPTAPFHQKARGSIAAMPTGMFGLLADVEYGLLPYAPVMMLGAIGIGWVLRAAPIAVGGGLCAFVMTLAIGASYVWWGGTSTPARFLVPVLPVLALGVASWWSAMGARGRGVSSALTILGLSLLVGGVVTERGVFLVNDPDGRDTLFEHLQSMVDVAAAMPSLFRPGMTISGEIALASVWALSAAAVAVAWRLWMRSRIGQRVALNAMWWVIAWITLGVSVIGTRTDLLTPDRSQLALLHRTSARWRSSGFVAGTGLVERRDLISRLSFRAPGRDDSTLLFVPRVPAGSYRISADTVGGEVDRNISDTVSGEVDPVLALELGRGAWPSWTWQAGRLTDAPSFTLVLPLHSLTVRTTSAGARRGIRLQVRAPLSHHTSSSQFVAERVTRYGELLFYSLDTATFVETGGFWLAGDREARFLVADGDGSAIASTLRVEAGPSPVTLRVQIAAGSVDRLVSLSAAERTSIEIPRMVQPQVVSVRVEGGFSAAQAFQQPGDGRWLGAWATVVPAK